MREIALHILDLPENSVRAGAKLVVMRIGYAEDVLRVEIRDDGRGMDEETLRHAESPFCTTRTTRRVGLGIPLMKQLTEMCDGAFSIVSREGEGTAVAASFRRGHIDLPPMGDLAETMRALLIACPESPDFRLEYDADGSAFLFDTRDIRAALGGVPLNMPEVLQWIGEYLKEGMREPQARTEEYQWRCRL